MKKSDFDAELRKRILPFWIRLIDYENGGFYGTVDFHLNIDPNSPKGGVIGARHLWSFSTVYEYTKDVQHLEMARHAYEFLKNKLWDPVNGGIYWLVDYQGNPLIPVKHIYAQSFALYGLSEYTRVTKDLEALEQAVSLFHLIEKKCFDSVSGGYFEEFSTDWQPKNNEILGEGRSAVFTTNSHLHLLEAYTNLYRVWPNPSLLEKVHHLLDLFQDKIFNNQEHYCHVAFQRNWEPVNDTFSFGHDIETSWLVADTLDKIGADRPKIDIINKQIAAKVAAEGMAGDGSLLDAKVKGKVLPVRVWWVEAEAVIGFYNAFQLTGNKDYISLSESVWHYIQKSFLDPRPNGEWYARLDENGHPTSNQIISANIADEWKGCYHNTRMCLEMIKRLPE